MFATHKRLPALLVVLVISLVGLTLIKTRERAEQKMPWYYTPPPMLKSQAKTASPAKPSAKAAAPSSGTRLYENGVYVNLVRYTGSSFEPRVVAVNRGETVRFVNVSNQTMRIASNVFDKLPVYRGFDQAKSVGKGGTFELSFTEIGIWGYHNLSGDQSVVGVVQVK